MNGHRSTEHAENGVYLNFMKPIDKIFIACYAGDAWELKLCVTSVRRWYPDIPIFLIKDVRRGRFSTRKLKNRFGADVYCSGNYGWGMSKLLPIVNETQGRFLVLDADTIMMGPVLKDLNGINSDFVVAGRHVTTYAPGEVERLYCRPRLLKDLDTEFLMPEYFFNTGHFVASGGKLCANDFSQYVDWSNLDGTLMPEIFPCGDQGLLNYLLPKMNRMGRITLRYHPFEQWTMWPPSWAEKRARFQDWPNTGDCRVIMHWSGLHGKSSTDAQAGDVLRFFEDEYHQKIGSSRFQRNIETCFNRFRFHCLMTLSKTKFRIRKCLPK